MGAESSAPRSRRHGGRVGGLSTRLLIPSLIGIALSACAITPESTRPTWERAFLHVSSDSLAEHCEGVVSTAYARKCMERLSEVAASTGRQFPVIVFLHGCLRTMGEHARWLARLGYVVVSPDSFARERRGVSCTGSSALIGMRIAEASFARERLRGFDWVDQERVILAGVSEGGMGAGQHPGEGFRAKVVMAWGCHNGSIRGSVPALNLVGALDTDNPRAMNQLCALRGESRAVHVPGRAHLFPGDAFATREIQAFLNRIVR